MNMTNKLLPFETVKTAENTDFTIIWLHGLGADGNDFVPLVPELNLPASLAIKFIFPHAPVRPITLNNGYEMRAWFDMFSLDRSNNTDESDLLTTVGWINDFIDQEVENGMPASNILIAGFSQGGVIALHAGLRYPQKLAGVMALSTYMPFAENVLEQTSEAQQGLSIFAAHGTHDPVIPVASWEDYAPKLEANGFNVEAHKYEMEHSLCAEEIRDISKWLQNIFL